MRVKEESEKAGLKLNIQKIKIMASSPDGEMWKQCQISFSWAPVSMWTVTAAMKLKDTCSLKKSYDKPRQCIKKQTHHFADKDQYSQSYDFCRSHVWM